MSEESSEFDNQIRKGNIRIRDIIDEENEGKMYDVIKFADKATPKEKKTIFGVSKEQFEKDAENLAKFFIEKNLAVDLPLESSKMNLIIKESDLDWLESYRKLHQLDTISEALTKLIDVYKAWQREIFVDN